MYEHLVSSVIILLVLAILVQYWKPIIIILMVSVSVFILGFSVLSLVIFIVEGQESLVSFANQFLH